MPTYRKKPKKIAIALLGQSNERGQVDLAEVIGGVASRTAHPQAFASLRSPGLVAPIGHATSVMGGPLFKLYDDLWDYGYDAHIINAAKGSLSLVYDACGFTAGKTRSFGFRAARPSAGPGDRGFAGDIMVTQGKTFRCTKGRAAYVMYNGLTIPNETIQRFELDYRRDIGSEASSASDVDYSAATLGQVIVDGTCEFTCISTSTSYLGATYNQLDPLTSLRSGFDPFGILHRTVEELQAVQGADFKAVIVQNGQQDIAISSATYAKALEAIATFFASRGIHVFLGLSCYRQDSGDVTAGYSNLTAGIATAVAAMATNAPGMVHGGANLYSLMGTTGSMAAGGAYFAKDSGQDNLHINAPGAVAMGGHMADAVKAVLPDRRPLTV